MGWAENISRDVSVARTAPYSALAIWDGDLRWGKRRDAEILTRLGAAVGVQSQASFRSHLRFCVYGSVLHPTIHCGEFRVLRVGK